MTKATGMAALLAAAAISNATLEMAAFRLSPPQPACPDTTTKRTIPRSPLDGGLFGGSGRAGLTRFGNASLVDGGLRGLVPGVAQEGLMGWIAILFERLVVECESQALTG